MSYRNDDTARADRAESLIREIAELERQKVAQLTAEQRLATARLELATLQAPSPQPAPPDRTPGLGVHLLVFATAAALTFAGYSLLL